MDYVQKPSEKKFHCLAEKENQYCRFGFAHRTNLCTILEEKYQERNYWTPHSFRGRLRLITQVENGFIWQFKTHFESHGLRVSRTKMKYKYVMQGLWKYFRKTINKYTWRSEYRKNIKIFVFIFDSSGGAGIAIATRARSQNTQQTISCSLISINEMRLHVNY